MANNIIKEYLVALGVKDNFTDKLDQTLQKGSQKVSGFLGKHGKSMVLAGTAVTSFFVTAAVGAGKLLKKVADADDELTAFAKDMGVTKDEAYSTKSALDAMGRSLDEIKADPKLLTQFEQLREHAENLKPPDMSKGLEQVRGIAGEFTKLKQTGAAAIQWIGHHLLKYAARPMEQIQGKLKGLNETVTKNLPAWSEKVGAALSWIVRFGSALIRGAGQVFNAIKKIFDMIPGNVKIAIAAFAALAMFIRAGPVGKLIMILSAALLLLEDFFTYLDGGDALLAPVWKGLIDIWNVLKDSGTIDKVKRALTDTMEVIQNAILKAQDRLVSFWNRLKENGAIGNFKEAFTKAGTAIGKVFTAAKDIVLVLLGAADDLVGGIEPFLAWLIGTAIPSAIGLISDVAGAIADFVSWLNKIGAAKPLIIGIVSAFAGLKIVDGITGSVKNLTGIIDGMAKAPGHISQMMNAFSGLKTSVLNANKALIVNKAQFIAGKAAMLAHKATQLACTAASKVAAGAQWALNAAMSANPIALIIIGIAALIAIVVLLVKNWDKVKEFFIKLWAKIKETFSGIAEWFGQKFTAAKEAVIAAFRNIGAWFGERVADIKGFFAGIAAWFGEKFAQAKAAVVGAFSSISEWFGEKVSLIVGFFTGIPGKLGELFTKAVKLIKDIFTGLPSWVIDVGKNIIKSMWNGITSMGSWLKDKVTGFFKGIWDGVKGVFGGGDGDTPEPDFGGGGSPAPSPAGAPSGMPGHAEGGVFDKEHVARFSEGDKAEAVVPLTKPQRAKEVLGQVSQYLGGGSSGESVKALTGSVQSFLEKATGTLDKIAGVVEKAVSSGPVPAMAQAGGSVSSMDKITSACSALEKMVGAMSQMNSTMTQGTAAAVATSSGSSSVVHNNQSYDMRSDVKVYDQSGSPQGVATAVDRAQQLRIRNMKGAFK